MESITILDRDYDVKTDDIIKVSLSWETIYPEGEEDSVTIDPYECDTKYNVTYSYPNDAGFTDVDFVEDAGFFSFTNIDEYLKENIKNDIPEIGEYELFDVEAVGEYQTAKIRVKTIDKIKED